MRLQCNERNAPVSFTVRIVAASKRSPAI